jgi:hypothetical protein
MEYILNKWKPDRHARMQLLSFLDKDVVGQELPRQPTFIWHGSGIHRFTCRTCSNFVCILLQNSLGNELDKCRSSTSSFAVIDELRRTCLAKDAPLAVHVAGSEINLYKHIQCVTRSNR